MSIENPLKQKVEAYLQQKEIEDAPMKLERQAQQEFDKEVKELINEGIDPAEAKEMVKKAWEELFEKVQIRS